MTDAEKTISIKLNENWIERLDKLAKRGSVSRHQLMRNLIEVGIGGISVASKVGFFQLGVVIRDFLNLKDKPKPGKEKPIPLKLDVALLDKIDSFAERGGLSKNQLMRNLITVGVEELERASLIGVLQLGLWMRDVENSIKKIIQDGSKAAQAVKDDHEITDMKGGETI